MRKLLRSIAREKMKKAEMDKPNRRLSRLWRSVTQTYPTDTITGRKMTHGYIGRKRYPSGSRANHLFCYSL